MQTSQTDGVEIGNRRRTIEAACDTIVHLRKKSVALRNNESRNLTAEGVLGWIRSNGL